MVGIPETTGENSITQGLMHLYSNLHKLNSELNLAGNSVDPNLINSIVGRILYLQKLVRFIQNEIINNELMELLKDLQEQFAALMEQLRDKAELEEEEEEEEEEEAENLVDLIANVEMRESKTLDELQDSIYNKSAELKNRVESLQNQKASLANMISTSTTTPEPNPNSVLESTLVNKVSYNKKRKKSINIGEKRPIEVPAKERSSWLSKKKNG